MSNPIFDEFFALGDKITKGDPKLKADFDYSMMWLMFIAFFSILLSNLWYFFATKDFTRLGWACVMFAILWFQYNNLKMFYNQRKFMKDIPKPTNNSKIESIDEMFDGFVEKNKK